MKRLLTALVLVWPLAAMAQDDADPAGAASGLTAPEEIAVASLAVEGQILPGFGALAEKAEELKAAAAADCSPEAASLRQAYHATFDAWMDVAHLRFGPSEADNRAFALAFWPDSRGATPKTLAGLIAAQDPIVDNPEDFARVSIAARGFFALDAMLYDESYAAEDPDYACRLTQAIAADIARTTGEIDAAWDPDYAAILTQPGPDNPVYFSGQESVQELYKALLTGLEFTADQRLGRPLGTFERPRPARAEAWRSGRSLRNVELSVAATGELAGLLASGLPEERRAPLEIAIERALRLAGRLDDPVFAGVEDPTGRLRVEVLQQSVNDVRDAAEAVIGSALGVSQGFNSLDGD
jgi:uncharacterized protein